MTSNPKDPMGPVRSTIVGDEDPTAERQPADAREAAVPLESIPERFGRYRILRAIGQGGMGTVFEARQEQPDRSVALKVISADYLSPSLLRRFEHESQVLGKLQHPGIAQIYEAGTIYDDRGRAVPFFAMEYIRGTELLRYATEHSLGTRARLALIASICDAVGHAHQKGIIHRDLKPNNILVDETGQPRILDFGVARATDSDIHTTQLTDLGQLIGTVPYMSPEQAGGDREDLDTRSDVYALGVITYELLAGRRPYDVERRMIHDAVRVIREEEPTPLSGINRELRGDVETIVSKALEKEKGRRYQTAESFAADIRHYLKDEPITARKASSWYQARKFAKRNKVLVAVLSTAFVLLTIGFITTAWQAAQARDQRDKAETVVAFMNDMIKGAGPYVALGRDATILKEMMTAAAGRIEKGELKDAPEAELNLRGTIGDTYRELALLPEATKMLEPAVNLARSLRGGDSADTATALANLGTLLKDKADLPRAETLLRESLEMRKRLYAGDHKDLASGMSALAGVLSDKGDAKGAEPLQRESLAMYRRLFPGDHAETAVGLNDMGDLLSDKGDFAAAEPLYREAIAMNRRLFPGDHPETATSINNLAVTFKSIGKLEEAEPLFRESLAMNQRLLPGDHQFIAGGLNNLASVLNLLGKSEEAEKLQRESLAMRRRLFPGGHPYVATALNNLALMLRDRGDFKGAEPLFRESIAMRQHFYKGDHASIAIDLSNLAGLLRQKGDLAAAEPLARQSVAMFERTTGKDTWPMARTRTVLARTLASQRRYAAAESEFIEAERVMSTAQGIPKGKRKECIEWLIAMYAEWNKAEPGKGHDLLAAEWKTRIEALP